MAPTGKSLIDITAEFDTAEKCLAYLEKLRWPGGVTCVKCGHDKVSRVKSSSAKQDVRYLYECLKPECGHQFTVTAGTIFHDTHLPIQKWFIAVALMLNARKGVSAKQMQRDLGVSYRTAWYLCHRIRKATAEGDGPMFTGTVEVDETYVGGKFDKRRKRERWDKEPVFGMVERGGKIRAYHVPAVNRFVLVGKIRSNISPEAELVVSDESHLYKALGREYRHQIVNHTEKEYVRGNIHTNTIDGYWSLFKRGVIGSYHKVSIKHLGRYLDEFNYRYNHRDSIDLFASTLAALLAGIALQYKILTAGESVHEPQV